MIEKKFKIFRAQKNPPVDENKKREFFKGVGRMMTKFFATLRENPSISLDNIDGCLKREKLTFIS